MHVRTENDPVPRRIGLAINHTNIAANKALYHIRNVALSQLRNVNPLVRRSIALLRGTHMLLVWYIRYR